MADAEEFRYSGVLFPSTANAGKTLLQSYSDGGGNALTGLSGESLLTLAE